MAKVSVIASVYNIGEEGLNRCLTSLTSQTLKDEEFIFIDDCSTDNSLAVLKEWARKDSRVKVIESDVNGGAAVARNKGLKAATGEYVGFVDADDAIDLDFYETLYDLATKDGDKKDIAKGIIEEIGLNGEVRVSNMNERMVAGGAREMYTEWTSAIYRRDMLVENGIDFPEQCPKSQHVVFLNRIISAADENAVVLTDEVAYKYYRRNGGLDDPKIPMKNFESALRAVDIIMDELNQADLEPEAYLRRYQLQFSALIEHTATQSREPEGNLMAAKAIIKHFHNCKEAGSLAAYVQEMYPPLYEAIVRGRANKIVSDYLGKYSGYKAFAAEQNGGRTALAATQVVAIVPQLIVRAKQGNNQCPEPMLCGTKNVVKPKGGSAHTMV